MSACNLPDLNYLRYPCLGSPKIDGIRCVIPEGRAKTKTMKDVPNDYIRECLRGIPFKPDGEIIVGDPTAEDCFKRTSSGVMSKDGEPDFKLYMFDQVDFSLGYLRRYHNLKKIISPFTVRLQHKIIHSEEEFLAFEQENIDLGYEGTIIRSLHGLYKCGRSTPKEGYLWKYKRFRDSEAEILDFIAFQKNTNISTVNDVGNKRKSTTKENLIKLDKLGALLVRDIYNGKVFPVGSGLNDEDRDYIWKNRSTLLGSFIKYKYFDVGAYKLPRHPVYLGPRNILDIDI
jgi:DNA ligase-1